MYKVFYNDSVLLLSDKLTIAERNFRKKRLSNKVELFGFLDDYLQQEKPGNWHLIYKSEKQLKQDFKSYFKYIKAAGGLVTNPQGKYLFIKRFGIWDLPKGKMENGESPAEAAKREVFEETAINGLEWLFEVTSTYHIYPIEDRFVLKCTFWFLMNSIKVQNPKPQLAEDITEAVWLNQEEAIASLETSYPSLADNFLPILNN